MPDSKPTEASLPKERRASGDRRRAPRTALGVAGRVELAGDAALSCTVHDISACGIGIIHDPRRETRSGAERLHLRRGDKLRLSFALPGGGRSLRASGRVRRVWARSGTIEIGIEVGRVNPEAMQAIVDAVRAQGRASEVDRRYRVVAPRELERLLRAVADDTFPAVASELESAAQECPDGRGALFFRALVRIEAEKTDIAQRFVELARGRLMPDLRTGDASDEPRTLRFDHEALAAAFSRACGFDDGDRPVRDVVEGTVVTAGFRHLAPPFVPA